MVFSTENPVVALRLVETNDIVEFAMRRNPNEYYDFIDRPPLRFLAERAGLRTAAEYAEKYDSDAPHTIDLFEAGIGDVIPPFTALAQVRPELPKDQALAIMGSDVTVATVGLLASMGEAGLHRLYDRYENVFALSDDEAGIVLARPVHSSKHAGCKAVDVHKGHLEMSPEFKKFVPWAGSLAVLAHFEYR